MPARGDAGDSTRKRSSRNDALQDKQSVTDDQQSGSPGSDSTEGDDCDDYVEEIVEYFYDEIPKERFTRDAENHIERTTAWALCYAYETGSNQSPKWWDGPEGRTYWQRHADGIAAILKLNDPECQITGIMVQAAIDEHAPRFVARLRRLLKTLELRAFESTVLPQQDSTPPRSLLDRDTIVKMLGFCPYGDLK